MKRRVAVKVLARCFGGRHLPQDLPPRLLRLAVRASNVHLGGIGSPWFTRYETRVIGWRTEYPEWMWRERCAVRSKTMGPVTIITGPRRAGITAHGLRLARASGGRAVFVTEHPEDCARILDGDTGDIEFMEPGRALRIARAAARSQGLPLACPVFVADAHMLPDEHLRDLIKPLAKGLGPVGPITLLGHPPTRGRLLVDLAAVVPVKVLPAA